MSSKLNNEFMKNPLGFFRQHPVVPPNDLGVGTYVKGPSNAIWEADKVNEAGNQVVGTETIYAMKQDANLMVKGIDFRLSKDNATPNAVTFAVSPFAMLDAADRNHGEVVHVHFLPWQSLGLVHMQIPDFGVKDELDSPANPRFFFTAAINGCSVFVRGNSASPEVYHGGVSGIKLRNGAQVWRDALSALTRSEFTNGRHAYEVNKTDYVVDEVAAWFGEGDDTRLAREFRIWLNTQHRKEGFVVQRVNPWGSVFGIRYGRMWSFYLQENATVTLLKAVKEKHVEKELTPQGRLKSATAQGGQPVAWECNAEKVPVKFSIKRENTTTLRVSEFYPGGPHSYKSDKRFQKMNGF